MRYIGECLVSQIDIAQMEAVDMPGQNLFSTVTLLIGSALCLSILIFQGLTGVPPLSSNFLEAADVVALLKQAGLAEQAVVYELGSGWGSLVIALARAFPKARTSGASRCRRFLTGSPASGPRLGGIRLGRLVV
jgi:hypothetical protein